MPACPDGFRRKVATKVYLPDNPYLPETGSRLATTFVAAGSSYPVARALGACTFIPLAFSQLRKVDGYLGWGMKPSSERARRAAKRRNLPFWRVEDGFLRSVGLGRNGTPSLSYAVDDLGIYYDASRPSRLEYMIAACRLTPPKEERARRFLNYLIAHQLSKYNMPFEAEEAPARSGRKRILLIDQTDGDLSIAGALASHSTFGDMVATARRENPDADLLLKLHPDHIAGLAASALGRAASGCNVTILAGGSSLQSLVDASDEIWTVSSQAGFEALWRGKAVTTFGVPFYAGWGLTIDRATGEAAQRALARRKGSPKTLLELVHSALIDYPLYIDPANNAAISPEAAAERLVLWRTQAREIGRNHLCVGFSRWKRPHARAYLSVGGGSPHFVTEGEALRNSSAGDHVVVWGMKADDSFAAAVRSKGARFSRMEDGFIRSFGLGSNFLFPWSLCLDDCGIYYDARQPSRLENLINSGPLSPEALERASRLRERLVKMGLTKYNLHGFPPPGLRDAAAGRTILLALGQVPDDSSIRLGRVTVADNLDFLTKARAENPDAYIIYKEHPDVVSGNRPGRSDPDALEKLANLVIFEGDTAKWIEASDHVHVMTSLAGFEALLRNRAVTCWGAPFYAGWGLTADKVPVVRRIYRPSLDELVGRTLIDYCYYRAETTEPPVSPEVLLDLIAQRPTAMRKTGLGDGAGGQVYRLLGYLIAQMAAAAGQRRSPKLRFAARSRWPFF